MASLQEIIALQRQREAEAAPSLANIKSANVAQKLDEKTKKVTSDPTMSPSMAAHDTLHNEAVGSGGAGALGLAAILRSGGNIADAARGVSNTLFEDVRGYEMKDDSAETGYSNQDVANLAAGVNPEYYRQFKEDQAKVLENVADKDWMGSLAAAYNVSGRTLLDSAGVVPEMVAGAGLTALAGPAGAAASGGLLFRRGKKIKEGAENVFDAFQDVKDARKVVKKQPDWKSFAKETRHGAKSNLVKDAPKVETFAQQISNLGKSAAKNVSTMSLVNLEMVQQARNDYKEANNGEEPSASRLATNAVVNAVTLSVNPAIIKKFYLPQIKTPGIDSVKKAFIAERQEIMKHVKRPLYNNIGRRVIAGMGKVAKAGGAEAVQEYAQTWGEILSVNMKPEERGGFWKSLVEEIGKEENINESITAAFLGGAAGGHLRGLTAVPTAAGGAVIDTAAATGKGIAEYGAKKVAERDFATLSEEKKQELKDDAQRAEVEYRALRKKDAKLYRTLGAAETVADIKDPEIMQDLTDRAVNQDLNDPKIFKTMKKEMLQTYKARAKALKGKQKVTAAAKVAKAYTGQVVEDVVELLPEDIKEKAVELAEDAVDLGEAAVEFVKNVDTEEAVGLARVSIDYSKNKTKEGLKTLRTEAQKQTPKQIRKAAKMFEESDPATYQKMNGWADDVEARLKRTGLKKDRILEFKDAEPILKDVAQRGLGEHEPVAVASLLIDEIKSRPADKDTVQMLQKALTAYEESDFHKNKEEGFIPPVRMKNAKKRLEKFAEAYATPVRDTIEGISINLMRQGIEAVKKAPKTPSGVIKWAKSIKITNPETKEVYRVRPTEAGDTFIKGLIDAQKQIKALPEEEQAVSLKAFAQQLANSETVAAMQKMFDTQDPAVLAEILTEYVPDLPNKKEVMKALAKKVESPTSQVTETVTKVKGTKTVPSGKITLNEVGDFIVDATLTKAEKDEVFDTLLGDIICKKG